MTRFRLVVFGAVVLAACRTPEPCEPTGDFPVVDHTTQGQPDLVQAVREVLGGFLADTNRDRLCLSEVRVVDVVDRRLFTLVGGRYDLDEQFIEVGTLDGAAQFRTTTRHELCHALDVTEDLSEAEPHAFLAELPDIVTDDYDESQYVREGYARVCAHGPRPPVDRWLEQACPDLVFGSPGQRVDERVTWRGAFPDPIETGVLDIAWQDHNVGGTVEAMWRAGRSILLLERTGAGHQLEWLDALGAPGVVVPLDIDVDGAWIWPGEDRALLLSGEPDGAHWRVDRSGEVTPLKLFDRYAYGPGAVVGDHAAGILVDVSGVPMMHELDLTSEVEPSFCGLPNTDLAEAGVDRLHLSTPGNWVLARTENGAYEEHHHGATTDGVDVIGGRLFRADARTVAGGTHPLLMMLTDDGQLLSVGCEAVDAMPARLGDTPVAVYAVDDGVKIGVVSAP